MQKTLSSFNENPKHAAFKRFSQMSAAGLAVLSLSAFTHVAAKQLPACVENCAVKAQNTTLVNTFADKPAPVNIESFTYVGNTKTDPYSEGYGDLAYTDIHSNHSNYVNNYADNCN